MRIVPVACALFWAACSSAAPSAEAPAGGTDLANSLEVEVLPDAVRLVLHVTNPTRESITFEFASGQRYDFEVRGSGGEEVWRWSADRMFTQALGTETLAPGGSLRYNAEWRPGGRKGSFQAIGRVPSSNRPVEQRTQFELR